MEEELKSTRDLSFLSQQGTKHMVQWFNQSRHAKTIAVGVSFYCFPLLYVDHHLIKSLQLDFLIWLFLSFFAKVRNIWFKITEQGKTWGILLFECTDRDKTVIFMNKLSRRQLFWRYKNRDDLEWVDFRIFIVLYQPELPDLLSD